MPQPSFPAGAPSGEATNLEVTLHPKKNYRLSLVMIPASLLFLLIWIGGAFDSVTRIEGIGLALVFVLGSIATANFLKADRTLIVDSHGVRLLRTGKAVNDIPWENVSRFRYGTTAVGPGVASLRPALFWVHAKDRYRGLSVVETYYDVPPGALWNASLFAAEMARARGIPVVEKNGLIRDFGP